MISILYFPGIHINLALFNFQLPQIFIEQRPRAVVELGVGPLDAPIRKSPHCPQSAHYDNNKKKTVSSELIPVAVGSPLTTGGRR